MNDDAEIHWRMYQEHRIQARHHEVLRSTSTVLILGFTGAVITVIGFEKAIRWQHWPLGMFLALIGIYGAIFAAKQYERILMHMKRAQKHRAAIDKLIPTAGLIDLRDEADAEHHVEFKWLTKVKLRWLWISIHLVITIIGIFMLVISLSQK